MSCPWDTLSQPYLIMPICFLTPPGHYPISCSREISRKIIFRAVSLVSQKIWLDFHSFQMQYCSHSDKQITGHFQSVISWTSSWGIGQWQPSRKEVGEALLKRQPKLCGPDMWLRTKQAQFQRLHTFTEHIQAHYFTWGSKHIYKVKLKEVCFQYPFTSF
jgi:hypothetical protein